MLRTSHFHVGNGDMTLVRLPGGRTLLIDVNIRGAADDPSDPTPDVARQLRERLPRGPDGRPYVDTMLLTHPDQDHCRGLVKHFHLGPPSALGASGDKILIRELWSSPIVFRRADRKRARENESLCEDAMAWGKEARRRVRLFRSGATPADGDRILILGEDEAGRRAPPEPILVRPGEMIRTLAGESVAGFSARLLAPLPIGADDDEERLLTKNNSSVILQLSLGGGAIIEPRHVTRYLFGGDAEVGIWERIRARYERTPEWLQYHVLIAPHHLSWRSLSHDSWSNDPHPRVSPAARWSLSRVEPGALVLASSVPVEANRPDPPSVGAEREYRRIVAEASPPGQLLCLGDERGDGPYELDIVEGVARPVRRAAIAGASGRPFTRESIPHGGERR